MKYIQSSEISYLSKLLTTENNNGKINENNISETSFAITTYIKDVIKFFNMCVNYKDEQTFKKEVDRFSRTLILLANTEINFNEFKDNFYAIYPEIAQVMIQCSNSKYLIKKDDNITSMILFNNSFHLLRTLIDNTFDKRKEYYLRDIPSLKDTSDIDLNYYINIVSKVLLKYIKDEIILKFDEEKRAPSYERNPLYKKGQRQRLRYPMKNTQKEKTLLITDTKQSDYAEFKVRK
jgi:hypothetical protein